MIRLSRMGHDVIAIHTLAAGELTLPKLGAVELIEAETGRRVVVQSDIAAPLYGERVRAWLQGFESDVRREGFDYLRVTTGDDLERSLRRFLVSRGGGR